MQTNRYTIGIASERCIRCEKCIRVCPAGIMYRCGEHGEVDVHETDNCIACGHCVSACPTDAVEHSLFPPHTLHPIAFASLPTPEQTMLLIRSRRSNRALTDRPVPPEHLVRIVEAARYAPTASNARQVSITVVTDPEKLRLVADFTVRIFDTVANRLSHPAVRFILKPFLRDLYAYLPALRRLKREYEAGNDPILRKATALVIFHTPAGNTFGCEDANLAYQNASLMAESLGVSQIYMGFVLRAIRQNGGGAFARITGVEGKVQALMALGIPAFRYPKYMER